MSPVRSYVDMVGGGRALGSVWAWSCPHCDDDDPGPIPTRQEAREIMHRHIADACPGAAPEARRRSRSYLRRVQ